ncbi:MULTISPECIES: M28 family metallopeptidase [unclassified Sphingomonas]|uniref:M28 family metallopeptidase n=1 Tax=Sphingomonas TaxID=13687 RepID=UPI000960C6F2|nr:MULTISPECIES: M28 family metallopeptidase [unclassified Sphingomonas]MBN8809744.1 M28 family peptidase [Sphingomonas sp.]OJY50377.1 MAG: aminopeptidase [Sphingomonas sp. 67-41]
MIRTTTPLALALMLALPAYAQNAPAPAPAPALTAAERNAIVNAELPADQAALKSHVMFLAADALKGREAGSPEFEIAAQYVVSQFYAAGLKPAGDEGGYLQKVPLVSAKLDGPGTMTVTRKGGAPVALEFGKDFVSSANPETPSYAVTAPVVFVGYGIVGQGRDDYRGVDVKGRIVAYFGGAPESFPGEVAAHFSNPAAKAEIAAKHGAIATITLESPHTVKARPFSFYANAAARPRFTWGNPDGTGHIAAPGTPSAGTVSLVGAEKLFAGARQKWADIAKAAAAPDAVFKAEALPVTVSVAAKTALTPVKSYNVAGMLPGSDPALSKEVVVLSAHLDHIGVGRPDKTGDTINNGALDDAVGIASLIEEAKRFKTAGTKPRRSILFLAVTAEEKGLVGSDYFANNPTVPLSSIVADVNLDMPIITYKFQDIMVYGAGHSTLGPIVERAGKAIGVPLSDDPLPGENIFVRSDHYNFVRKGVPSVFLWPGAGGPGRAAYDDFMKNHYHQPSDEIGQLPAIDWESGVRFVDVNYRIAREIADGEQRPVWNKGDFFGLTYNGPGAK